MPEMKLSLLCLLLLGIFCFRLWVTRIRIFFNLGFFISLKLYTALAVIVHYSLRQRVKTFMRYSKGYLLPPKDEESLAQRHLVLCLIQRDIFPCLIQSQALLFDEGKNVFLKISHVLDLLWSGRRTYKTAHPNTQGLSSLSLPPSLFWCVTLLELIWTWEMGKEMEKEKLKI